MLQILKRRCIFLKGNKMVIILLIVIIILLGGGGAYLFLNKGSDGEAAGKTPEVTEPAADWNPYASEKRLLVALNDYLISAANGDHVVKFSATIELSDEAGLKKYQGWTTEEAAPAGDAGHGDSDEHVPTPMETIINATVNDAMLSLDAKSLYSVPSVQKALKDKLNAKLGLGDTFIKEVYIENYLIQ